MGISWKMYLWLQAFLIIRINIFSISLILQLLN